FPNNQCYQLALTCSMLEEGNFGGAVKRAEQVVRCSASNPNAWRILDTAYSQWSEDLRKGRTADKITEEEWDRLQQRYEPALEAGRRAAALDPHHLGAGLDVSSDAAFAGDLRLADEALSRMFQEYPEDPRVYRWGLRLYHHLWQYNREKARALVESA